MKSTISFLLLAGNELSVQASPKYELLPDTQQTWHEARAACQETFGTDLASLHSMSDYDEAYELCQSKGADCWIGLHRDSMGVCEPIERIRAMKDGPRNYDYILWVDRCQVSGSNGQCGSTTEWPVGDGGRCQASGWKWSDGSTSDFGSDFSGGVFPWAEGEPNDANGGEECAEMRKDMSFEWNDSRCNRLKYALCNAVGIEYEALTLGTNAKGIFGKTIDIGEEAFNEKFAGSKIIKRECPTCADSHKLIFYRRISPIGNFNAYANMKSWTSVDNNMYLQDFALYSTLDDAINDENRWTFCNYNDAGIGFPRDCGPSGHVAFQWTSATRGGKASKFSIISGTCGAGDRGNGICRNPSMCCSNWGWCSKSVAHCGVSVYPDCKPDCLIDGKYQHKGMHYEVNGKCYLALTNCWACLDMGADNYPDALKPVSCSRMRRRLIEE